GSKDQGALASAEVYDPSGRAEARPSTQDAAEYLEAALDWIQENAMTRDKVDWARVRREAMAKAANASTTADTYPAIRYALDQVGDLYVAFRDPDQAKVYAQFQRES